ncbi:hypothetical protein EIP91_001890 [Steccherinum ochraceum]|uniref:Uncharacterized protein n=1 Tax=Steccherinum ochraceum TaxID=92696 RepID=A0A4R0RTV9_9APHY|nr:hypothetical protein EIP91_001890 [Steccherinum ochraceum]
MLESTAESAICQCKSIAETRVLSTRDEIEQEIASHIDLVVHLRRRLNHLAPIDRLQTELLALIFHHFIREVLGLYNFPQRLLSCVCRRWHDVVSGSPELWTRVHTSSYPNRRRSEFLQQLLEKSKDALLDVRVNDYMLFRNLTRHQTSTDPSFSMRMITPHIGRIAVLRLAQRHQDLEASIALLPSIPPQLHALEVTALAEMPSNAGGGFGAVGGFGWHRDTPSMRVVIPNIYSWNLRKLVLRNGQMDWARGFLPRSLTQLSIVKDSEYGPVEGSQPKTFSDIMNILATLPLLSKLCLQCVLPIAVSQTGPGTTIAKVALPRLSSLRIDERASVCLFFLHHLEIPANATVNSSLQNFPRGALSTLTSWLVSRVNAEENVSDLPKPSVLVIDDGRFQVIRGEIQGPYRRISRWDESDLALDALRDGISDEMISTWVLRDALPRMWHWVRNVTTLDIFGLGCFGIRDHWEFVPERQALWRTLLHSMPNITVISICADIRLPALLVEPLNNSDATDGGGSSPPRYLLPNLVAIKHELVTFAGEVRTEKTRLRTSLLDWRDALRTRKEAGCADVSMLLAYCHVIEADLAALREVATVRYIEPPSIVGRPIVRQ